MVKKKKKKKKIPVRKLVATESMYLDSLGCDSTVGYNVIKNGTKVSGTIDLTDCNRKIGWYFGGRTKNSLAKIENAIYMLTSFKNAYIEAGGK